MAAPSSSNGNNNNNSFFFRCFHCQCQTPTFKNGWQLRSGSVALLCEPCGSAYENGTFCLRFHRESDGWRDCRVCLKMLHCGCIVSKEDIILMDYGGICCLDCRKKHLSQVDIARLPVNDCLQLWNSLRAQSMDHCFNGELYVGSEEPMTDVQLVTPPCKEQSSLIGDNSIGNSSSEKDIASESYEEGAGSHGVLSGLNIQLKNLPNKKRLRVPGTSNSTRTTLFQKVLSYSDARPKNGRLIIPRREAEAFLPKLDEPKGVVLEVLDTSGVIWNFNYRYWLNTKGRIYVIEGIRDYIKLWDWQPGDIVKFYRTKPARKLMIATKKMLDDLPALKKQSSAADAHALQPANTVAAPAE